GARVGIGDGFEVGLAYTGRAARVDVRRAFDLSETWSISVGAGGSAALYGRSGDDGTNAAIPGADLARLHGWGADVPVLIGYASAGDLYMLWAGARAGWEHVTLDDAGAAPGSGGPPSDPQLSQTLSATRFWGGGLVGLAAGFRHLHVAMELDVSYATVSGDYGAPVVQHVRVDG